MPMTNFCSPCHDLQARLDSPDSEWFQHDRAGDILMFLFNPGHDEKPKLRKFSERQKFKILKKKPQKSLGRDKNNFFLALSVDTKQLEINFSNSRKLFYGLTLGTRRERPECTMEKLFLPRSLDHLGTG